jgi:EF hand
MKMLMLVVLMLSITASLPGSAAAQPPRGPRGGPGGPGPLRPDVLEGIVDDLKLPEKDKAKVDAILQAHEEKMRRARDEARTALLRQMKEVLDDKQYAQFKQEIDRRPPPPPRGGGARGVSIDLLVEHVMSFDKNKDGKVTKEELPDRLHYLIEMGDTNKDGALTRDELKAVAIKINQTAGPRGPGDLREDDLPPRRPAPPPDRRIP